MSKQTKKTMKSEKTEPSYNPAIEPTLELIDQEIAQKSKEIAQKSKEIEGLKSAKEILIKNSPKPKPTKLKAQESKKARKRDSESDDDSEDDEEKEVPKQKKLKKESTEQTKKPTTNRPNVDERCDRIWKKLNEAKIFTVNETAPQRNRKEKMENIIEQMKTFTYKGKSLVSGSASTIESCLDMIEDGLDIVNRGGEIDVSKFTTYMINNAKSIHCIVY